MRDFQSTTNLSLLANTQIYLLAVLNSQEPDSLLTQAWDEFYRVYNELIRRFVLARNIPRSEVDDCVQEVWSAVATHLAEFQRPPDRSGLRAWLYCLVASKTADAMRKRGRHAAQSLDVARAAGFEPAAAESSLTGWDRVLVETLLEDLRDRESDTNYRIVQMRLLEGRRAPEIAAALGLDAPAVRYRLHRALKKLRLRVALYTGSPLGAIADIEA